MISPPESADGLQESLPATAPAALGPVRLCLLSLWVAASFGTCYFARDLQALLGPHLESYDLAAQGVLIVFIVLVLFNAWYFNRQGPDQGAEADHGV